MGCNYKLKESLPHRSASGKTRKQFQRLLLGSAFLSELVSPMNDLVLYLFNAFTTKNFCYVIYPWASAGGGG